jgi:predicted phage tail protein
VTWNTSGETISITVDGLSEGTYVYQCTVYDSAGQGVFDEVTVTVLEAKKPPSQPLKLTAIGSNSLVTLTWEAPSYSGSSEIIEYRVYRSIDADHYTFLGSTTSLEFIDSTVSNGVTYYYVATVVNAHGESEHSNEVSVIPIASSTSETTETSMEITSSTEEPSSPTVTNGFSVGMIVLPLVIVILISRKKDPM